MKTFFALRKAEDIVEDLYSDIHRIGTGKDFDQHIADINKDNVVEVLKAYDAKSSDETLVEAIFDEIGLASQKRIDSVTHIKDALIERSKKLGVEVDELNREFEAAFNDATSGVLAEWYVDTTEIDKLISEYTKRLEKMEAMIKAADDTNQENPGMTIISQAGIEIVANSAAENGVGNEDLMGNGKIDHNARQMNGNCWAHAGINAIIATPKGKEMINNLITKKDGVISVYLPEAANKGYPKPDGDGIYTFTEWDIALGTTNQSIGDGDVTAIMLAVEKYFEESGEQTSDRDNVMDSNTSYRMFEILSGKTCTKVYFSNTVPDGVGSHVGLNTSLYQNLKEMISNGQGGIYISFKDGTNDINTHVTLLSSNYQEGAGLEAVIADGHAYAVTKMDDDYVYLVESNNPNTIIQMTKDEFIKKVDTVSTLKY